MSEKLGKIANYVRSLVIAGVFGAIILTILVAVFPKQQDESLAVNLFNIMSGGALTGIGVRFTEKIFG